MPVWAYSSLFVAKGKGSLLLLLLLDILPVAVLGTVLPYVNIDNWHNSLKDAARAGPSSLSYRPSLRTSEIFIWNICVSHLLFITKIYFDSFKVKAQSASNIMVHQPVPYWTWKPFYNKNQLGLFLFMFKSIFQVLGSGLPTSLITNGFVLPIPKSQAFVSKGYYKHLLLWLPCYKCFVVTTLSWPPCYILLLLPCLCPAKSPIRKPHASEL